MKIIGLTGGIASGKSTASSILKSFGATIIDADILAKKAVEPGKPALKKIVKIFGESILNKDGTLNRKLLAKMIFNDEKKRELLNNIVHPDVYKMTQQLFQEERKKGRTRIIYDCPLLIEEHLTNIVDEVWLIYVDEKIQLKRLMQRNHLTREQAMNRIKSQLPLKEKIKYADILIDNNGSLLNLEDRLRKLWYD
ncbi:dephospho-CoA kinase [Garciella nitratireducens]|uniref:Dephospho-CoA kinase n=1 Tax=Garciella nitratireducens DSM 15102 TaxID=1121911 RepID=A0A1T4KAA1_9FIRM|nr:dephospho-CoA kinase [Garciella nitratireducens]RBP46730.1 dephospho-CoA kinase [Garciella nitratireducens]SJZ39339.1 dephospho-CoA kinase [Garciella nitratireducens DSM 15102]